MRTFVEIEADARPGSPFSNGTSGAMWMEQWCDRCVHDRAARDDNGRPDPTTGILGCPLVAVALIQQTPVEWFEQENAQDYHCIEFRDEDADDGPGEPQPIPDPPGMEALLPREPYTAPLMFTANTVRPAEIDR